jgi:hypothetical protein
MSFCWTSEHTCPLDAAEAECLAFDRELAAAIRAAVDVGEQTDVRDVLDVVAWIDERRSAARTCAATN